MQVIPGTPLPDDSARPEEPTVMLNEAEEPLFGRIAANIGKLVCEPVIDSVLEEQQVARAHLELAQARNDDQTVARAKSELENARRKVRVAAGVAGPALAWRVEKMLRDAA